MASATSHFRHFKPYTCPFCGATVQPHKGWLGGDLFEVPGICHCDGARAQREAEELAEAERREAELARQTEAIYRRAGIRPRFMRVAPDRTHLAHVEDGRGLYLVGDTNAGKTHAAVALLKAYIDAHTSEQFGAMWCARTARIVNVPDLLSEWKATYGRSGEDEAQVTARYGDADLLVLDDLGKGAPTAWALERLFQVVNRRYDRLLPTVVTTQYEPPDLGRRLAETGDRETARAIVRRLTCSGTLRVALERRPWHG